MTCDSINTTLSVSDMSNIGLDWIWNEGQDLDFLNLYE